MSKDPLKILLLEDDPNDVELVNEKLLTILDYSIDFKWVKNKSDFIDALDSFRPDLVLSDFNLPYFVGTEALKICIKKLPLVPFIVVTGSLTEEAAANSILNGAWDYVVKERLYRLPRAINNALKLKEERLKALKAQEEMKENEKWYKAIFENTGTATILVAEDNTIILSNGWFEKLSGYSCKDVDYKMPWTDFVLNKQQQQRMRHYHKVLIRNGNVPKRYEIHFYNRYGVMKNIMLSVDLIPDTKITVASLLNITDLKAIENRLSSSEEKFRLISNSAHDGIIMSDENKMINYWNPATEKIFGLTGETLLDMPLAKLINRTEYEIDQMVGNSFDIEYARKDGTVLHMEISLATLKINDQWGAVSIIRDITERKSFEKELILARDQAEESDRLKSAFLATMSHELRTPLNAIIGFSSIIDESMGEEEILNMVKIINESGNHLLSIIDSVFSLSLFQSGSMKIKNEQIKLREFIFSLDPYIKSKLIQEDKQHIHVKCENYISNTIQFYSDKAKLTQMIVKFFDNAVKYTERGEISYGAYIDENNIIFFVKDTGIGIKADKQQLIFEQFQQLEDFTTRRQGGVGLGLAICQEIAVLLEADVWVDSELNKGSTFYCRLNNVFNSE